MYLYLYLYSLSLSLSTLGILVLYLEMIKAGVQLDVMDDALPHIKPTPLVTTVLGPFWKSAQW